MTAYSIAGLVGVMLVWAPISFAATPPPELAGSQAASGKSGKLPPLVPHGGIDHSGRKQKGRASFYAHHFTDRKMADGSRFLRIRMQPPASRCHWAPSLG